MLKYGCTVSIWIDVVNKFHDLFTPHIADALVRQQLPLRVIGNGINPIKKITKIAGSALPVPLPSSLLSVGMATL